jgi:hypothetical protein
MSMPDRDQRRRRCMTMFVLALSATVIAVAPAPAAQPVAEVSAFLTPGELAYGMPLSVSGRVTAGGHGVGDAALILQADPHPYRGFAAIARVASAPDGSFAFTGLRGDRNARLRVLVEGSPAAVSPVRSVLVDPSEASNAALLGPGRTRLSLRVRHTLEGGSASVGASWFVAARGTHVFRLVAVTPTRELSAGVTYASAIIDPPSRRFSYRVCLNPPWERAMGAGATHGPCPEHDFVLSR